MTRMTETASGEIHFFKPMLGSAKRDAYDRAHAGEIMTTTEATSLLEFGMEFDTIQEYKSWKQPGQFVLRGEWHDFVYYPRSQVCRIEAEEYIGSEYRQDDDVQPDDEL